MEFAVIILSIIVLALLGINIYLVMLYKNAKSGDSNNNNLDDFSNLLKDELNRSAENSFKFIEHINSSLNERLYKIEDTERKSSDILKDNINNQLKDLNNVIVNNLKTYSDSSAVELNSVRKTLSDSLNNYSNRSTNVIEKLREHLTESFTQVRNESNKNLEKIRLTVDEKLTESLEEKLTNSYKIINEQLEKVARGFGEIRQLSSGVNDLKKVITNVKTLGNLGEVMLGNLLEQMLSKDQYKTQFNIQERVMVDFAIILPGKNEEKIYLPIDSKFPITNYQKMLNVQGDAKEYEKISKELTKNFKNEAKKIAEKYIKPPKTTDFAIMYLPTEGLFAEAVKREGLMEEIHDKYRVIFAGPTTLSALLSSLQMGFKTLAIEKRSMEIRDLLIAFKTEFIKFTDIIEKAQKKLGTLSNELDNAARKTKTINRKLVKVESLTDTEEDLIDIQSSIGIK